MSLRLPPLELFVDGSWMSPRAGRKLATHDPHDDQVIAEVAVADAHDVDTAVRAARDAQPAWAAWAPQKRAACLWRLGDLLLAHADEIGALESADTGKPLREARGIDVPQAADHFHYAASLARSIEGATLPVAGPSLSYTVREPLGVVALITPWNFPLLLAAGKIGAALAAGNAIIHKPSELTPLSALRLAELAEEAGLPAGVWNVLPGPGDPTGSALVAHPGVAGISFTGSTAVGKSIMQVAAGSLKKVSLELGGKSPMIVLPDADLERAARAAAMGVFYNAGEVCTASSRLFVHRDVHDTVVEAIVARAARIQPGNPRDASTRLGPLISQQHRERVHGFVSEARDDGARLQCGGKPAEVDGGGWYYPPTVFTHVEPHMRLAREEVFGPVLSVLRFDDDDDLIEQANDVDFGLAAGIWTRQVDRALAMASRLQAGTIWINGWNQFDAAAPYGGTKSSGFGRESGRVSLDSFTQWKTIWVDMSEGGA